MTANTHSPAAGQRLYVLLAITGVLSLVVATLAFFDVVTHSNEVYPHQHLGSVLSPVGTFLLCAGSLVGVRWRDSVTARRISRVLIALSLAALFLSIGLLLYR